MGRARRVIGVVLVVVTLVVAACAIERSGGDKDRPAAGPSSTLTTPATPDGERPNIVLILTDDQTLDEMAVLPKTRRLIGSHGTTFSRAFSQYPLCCPARATLLTGQLPHNHGVLGNQEPWGGYGHFDESSTTATWLHDAGYQTGIVGKYLNGYPEKDDVTHVPPGWDDWHVPVKQIYNYRSYLVNQDGELKRHHQYQSGYTADTADRLIRHYSESDDPFFLWTGFLAPHVGGPIERGDPRETRKHGLPTPAVEHRYRGTVGVPDLSRKASVYERDTSDKVPWLATRRSPAPDELRKQWQQRREALRSVDDGVAQIVRTLRHTGELDNTVLLFTSDNGYLLGEHDLDQKIYGYEESVHVPLLMSGPGIPQGVTRDQQVGLTDLPATVLDLAGVRPGLTQDGLSLVPMTHDPDLDADRPLLLEAGGWPFKDEDRLYTGVRLPDDKVLLRWYDGWEETYDLRTDPLQLRGGTSPAEAAWKSDAEELLDRLETCVGEECTTATWTAPG